MADRYPPWQVDSYNRLGLQQAALAVELEALTHIRNTTIKDLQALPKVDSSRQALSKAIDILSAKMIPLKPAFDAWTRECEGRANQASRL